MKGMASLAGDDLNINKDNEEKQINYQILETEVLEDNFTLPKNLNHSHMAIKSSKLNASMPLRQVLNS
jgi:hypothetical protein